jgi:PKD repeat protein
MFKVRFALASLALAAVFTSLAPEQDSPLHADSESATFESVALKNGLSPEKLSHMLKHDPAVSLDAYGNILYTMRPSDAGIKDPSLSTDVLNSSQPSTNTWSYGGIDYTTKDAFSLHSNPDSPLRIYLDFTGHTTSDPYWDSYGGSTFYSAPLDYDSNPASFSQAERVAIGKVWSAVAEDFAPWDVDVTTQEPDVEDLKMTSNSDTRYGVRIVMTPTAFMNAGGVAFMNSFTFATDTPAFCFCTRYSANDMALVVSHETGHTVGLDHDGRYGREYYGGHGSWGPLMGAPYGLTMSQWSNGDYSSSTNRQDDFSVINSFIPYVPDDMTNTYAAAQLPSGLSFAGRISNASDKDWFKVYSTGTSFSISVNTAQFANLDPMVELWRNNVLVSKSDPDTLNLSTTFSSLSPGEYRLMIDGTDYATASDEGYSDYGSAGDYRVTLSGSVSIDAAPQVTLTPSVNYATSGTPVTFSVSSSINPSLEGLSILWSLSNGATASGTTATVDMPSVGPLKATVIVTSPNGTPSVASAQVRLSKAPTVSASVSKPSIHAGTQVSFMAVGKDPDRQAVSYSWVFSDGSTSQSPVVFKNPTNVGVFTGTVTLTDADGNSVSSAKDVTVVENLAPSATVSVSRSSGAAPVTISFTAVGSDPERSALTYLWSFPDGSSATSPRVTKTLSTVGLKTVTVKVTDSGGFSVTKSVDINITGNSPPVISSASVSSASLPAPARFSFKALATDSDKHTITYTWAFSDGSSLTGPTVFKLFSTPGPHTATVTATDAGGLSVSRDIDFTVTPNSPPTVGITYSGSLTKVSPASYLLNAVASDVDKQSLTYKWVFSDGTSSSLASVSKKFLTAGTYTATVTVTDVGGLTASSAVTLTVTPNSAPVISSASVSLASAPAGSPRVFSVQASDPDGQSVSYKWVFSSGGTSSSKDVARAVSIPGSYTATVTVTDSGGLSVSRVVSFTVT